MSSDFNEEDNINNEVSQEEIKDTDIVQDKVDSTSNDSDVENFGDLSIIDISSDVEYQLNQERTGVSVVKLEKNKSTRGMNGFDIFCIKVWAVIVSFVNFISGGICKAFNKVFKRELPKRYVNAFVSLLLIILTIVLVLAPFNLTIGDKNKAEIFSNSLIPVKNRNGKWGYANKGGKIVINCKYDDAEPFYNNVAFVRSGDNWRLIGTNGAYKGSILVKQEPGAPIPVGDFNNKEKKALIVEYEVDGTHYSFMQSDGKRAFGGVRFTYAEPFSNGYALVNKGGANTWYFINGNGTQKGPTYYAAKSFSEGLAAVRVGIGWTFVNKNWKEITKDRFDAVTSFKKGYAWVRMANSINLIDKNGKLVLPVGNNNDYNGLKPSDEDLRELGMEEGFI